VPVYQRSPNDPMLRGLLRGCVMFLVGLIRLEFVTSHWNCGPLIIWDDIYVERSKHFVT